MALPYKLFAGGTVGSGKQWMSWVHVKDVARAIAFAIENENLQWPCQRNSTFSKTNERIRTNNRFCITSSHWFPVTIVCHEISAWQKKCTRS